MNKWLRYALAMHALLNLMENFFESQNEINKDKLISNELNNKKLKWLITIIICHLMFVHLRKIKLLICSKTLLSNFPCFVHCYWLALVCSNTNEQKKIMKHQKWYSYFRWLFRVYLSLIQENPMKTYFTLRNELQFFSMEFTAFNALILFRRQYVCCVYLHVIWKCLVHLHRMAHKNGQCRQWCWSRANLYSSEGWLPAKVQNKIEREKERKKKTNQINFNETLIAETNKNIEKEIQHKTENEVHWMWEKRRARERERDCLREWIAQLHTNSVKWGKQKRQVCKEQISAAKAT